MPKFYLHTPKSQGDMKAIREASKSMRCSYGFGGDKYYVTIGSSERLLTRMALSMDEANQLSILFNFDELIDPTAKDVNRVIKSARKNKLKGDELFWYLQNEL